MKLDSVLFAFLFLEEFINYEVSNRVLAANDSKVLRRIYAIGVMNKLEHYEFTRQVGFLRELLKASLVKISRPSTTNALYLVNKESHHKRIKKRFHVTLCQTGSDMSLWDVRDIRGRC